MDLFSQFVGFANGILWDYVVIFVLIGMGIGLSFMTGFVQLRMLKEMILLLFGSVGKKASGNTLSSFQTFCLSTAARVGTGNIAGVAIAIVLGGPGAIFWMWVIAFLGCATGFVESTLAQIYKLPKTGSFYGGPAYYIQNVLGQKYIARIFAVCLTITFALIYNSVQSNTIAGSMENAFGVSPLATTIVITILTAICISGGLRRVSRITEIMVPVMAILYLLVAGIVVLMHLDQLPAMFALIIHDAFSPQAAVGGGIGTAIITGVKRGLFSNEAGEGSVPNAAATADVRHPVVQGLIQSFGVYVDTWIVCSATAFIVLLTGMYSVGGEVTGVALVQNSLEANFGDCAAEVTSVMVFLFAFSSILANTGYGEINMNFFDGYQRLQKIIFRTIVVAMVFFGGVMKLGIVWDMADLFMGIVALLNLYAVFRLAKYARIALKDYCAQKKNGVEEPSFDPTILGDQTGVFAWKQENAAADK